MLRGIGVYFDMRNPPAWRQPWASHYAAALERMVLAEQFGASTIWLTEHHFFEDGYLPQPLTLAAAVGTKTQRARIGTAVYLPLLRHPMQVAEEAAMVDILSAGRLDLGMGTGYRAGEYVGFGTSMDRRFIAIEAHIRAVRDAWDGDVMPPPVQDPVPLWGGFFGVRGARLAGRLKMGLLAADSALLDSYHRGLMEGGHLASDGRLRALSPVFVADDPDAAWPLVKAHVDYQWNSYRWYEAEGTDRRPIPFDVERWRPGRTNAHFVLTDVEGAVAHIQSMSSKVPLEEVYCWATLPGLPGPLADRHMELLLTKVRPAVVAKNGIADAGTERSAVRP